MSIKVEELRIGNAINLQGKPINVNLSTLERILFTEMDKFKKYRNQYTPIELTEEILLKCGFLKREDGGYNIFKYSEVDIVICSDFSSWKCDGINFSVGCIEHLHQLQNLYFALTNEELNVKL